MTEVVRCNLDCFFYHTHKKLRLNQTSLSKRLVLRERIEVGYEMCETDGTRN